MLERHFILSCIVYGVIIAKDSASAKKESATIGSLVVPKST